MMKVGKNQDEVAAILADCVLKAIEDKQGPKVIGLSGGSLPKIFAQAVKIIGDRVNWKDPDLKLILCDERLVDQDDEDSNAGTIVRILGEDFKSSIVSVNTKLDPAEAAADYEEKLKTFKTFDLLLLGMGPDGHTCSLFPDHPLLKETSKVVADITDSPKPPPCRVTLTLPAVNDRSEAVVFVATGAGKKPVLEEIFSPNPEVKAAARNKYPAALVEPKSGNLTWIVDTPAAP